MMNRNAAATEMVVSGGGAIVTRKIEPQAMFAKWLRSWSSVALAKLWSFLAGPVR